MTTTPTSGAADLRATFSEMLVDLPNTEPYTLFQAGFDAALAAGQATAAQQGAAYAALPESFLEIPDVQDESGINAYYSREVVLECIDAALASHGQAPAQPDQPIACSYGDNGYACCEGGPCQADVHNDKLAEQQAPATARADSVQEDAARYRWLREGNDAKHGAAWHVAVNLYGCEWDAAIDAAMTDAARAAQKEGE